MKKLLLLPVLAMVLLQACKKTDFDTTVTGEGLGTFRMLGPATGTNLFLNSATPGATVQISWTAAKPGIDVLPTYKWVVAPQNGGNLDQPLFSIPSDNNGLATTLTLTHYQVDSILQANGIADNAATDFVWSVVADNGSTIKRADESFFIRIQRMGDGIAPFKIYGPLSSAANLEINPTSTADSINFYWQKAIGGNPANPVTYKVVFIEEGGNFSNPLFSITPGNNGTDTTVAISYKDISDSLTAAGLSDPSQVANLEWTVIATSGNFELNAMYVNELNIVRLVRMFLVGSINGWDINNPLEMIADKAPGRQGKVFYSYVRLNATDEFKFFRTVGDWGSGYGNAGTSGAGYTTGYNQGGNFQVPNAGVYRLTIDLENNMAYVQEKQVGLVGSLQGWDPANPVFGSLIARNRFMIITDMTAGDIFKFHDGPAWDNSTVDKARWWGKGASDGLLDYTGNGDNLENTGSTGRVRAIWDGTELQVVKYILNSAAQMRVVGDGIQGVNAWDPGASPQMTYMGDGKWQITLDLVAGKDIKFLAGDAWGAFDYEDASGGSTATGTPKPMRWDGSDNFKTPATSGSYTIVLDEYAQTVTIN